MDCRDFYSLFTFVVAEQILNCIINCYSKERKVLNETLESLDYDTDKLAVGMKFGRDIHGPRKTIIVLLFGCYDVQLFSRGFNCLW